MYKLSIIIPTYNGGCWIEDTIKSVIVQLKDYADSVELFIRDNASSDNTKAIIERINNENDGIIHYDRRDTNADADTNFREAVLLTSSEYVLLLGDDDLLFPNFIKYTLELLKRYPDIGLLYYNRICTTRDYEGAILKHHEPNSSFVRLYNNAEDFIKDHPSGPDFMSVNIVKRDCLIKGIPHSKQEYYGVEWYFSVLFGLQGYKCLASFVPMILQRVPSVSNRYWSDKVLLYVGVGMDNMFSELSKYYPNIYRIWSDYSHNNISMISFIISCIPMNRELYREKWTELSPKLTSWNKRVAYCIVFKPYLTPIVRLICRLYIKISK